MGIGATGFNPTVNNTTSTLKTSVVQDTQNLEQLNSTITTTADTAAQLKADGENSTDEEKATNLLNQKKILEDLINILTQKANILQQQIEGEQAELERLSGVYEQETANLQELEEQFDSNQKKLADLNEEIAYTQDAEQKRFEGKISDITDAAINEYDPEKDGDDFNAFLSKRMSSVGIYTYSALDSLNSDASKLANDTNGLLGDIKNQAGVVRNLAAEITSHKNIVTGLQADLQATNGEIETNNAQLSTVKTELNKLTGAGLSGAELLAQISDAEKALVKDNNIDLTETFEDGSPKYVIARGQDDKYHIYQMDGPNSEGATSLARQFGKTGGGLRGSDIVPSGSGYMRNIQSTGDAQGRAVYSLSCVNEDLTDGEACSEQKCYCTCSPLSFDVDGDGIHTTSGTVKYDIDGDGILDTVNNSAEWVLAFDKDGNGIAGENGSELFGDNTDLDGDGVKDGYANGFEALKALAQKEGLVGANGGVLNADDLKVLQDKYGLVMTQGYGGEAKSLADLGITEINLSSSNDTNLTKNFDGRHNDIMTQEGATFKVNGQTREYADVWNAKLDSNDAADAGKMSERMAAALSFDVDAFNLDYSLGFLNKSDALEAVDARLRNVDFDKIIVDGISDARVQQSAKQAADEIQERLMESRQPENEEEDEDFMDFQKKKLK